MAEPTDQPPRRRDRQERQLGELLQELRVALPGVQLLLGFLLTIPFNQRFGELDDGQRVVYLVALLAAVASSACLIAPAAFHRLVFHRGERAALIALTSRLLLIGLSSLGIAITASVLLVTSFLFSDVVAGVVTAVAALLITGLWFGIGLAARGEHPVH